MSDEEGPQQPYDTESINLSDGGFGSIELRGGGSETDVDVQGIREPAAEQDFVISFSVEALGTSHLSLSEGQALELVAAIAQVLKARVER